MGIDEDCKSAKGKWIGEAKDFDENVIADFGIVVIVEDFTPDDLNVATGERIGEADDAGDNGT